MRIDQVAEFLGVDEQDALGVMSQLQGDGVADGTGTGPISKNMYTSVVSDYYDDIINQRITAERNAKMMRAQNISSIVSASLAFVAIVVSVLVAIYK